MSAPQPTPIFAAASVGMLRRHAPSACSVSVLVRLQEAFNRAQVLSPGPRQVGG